MTNKPTEPTIEWLQVSDLEIDRSVQRSSLDVRKVERFVKNFNEDALGVITVSKRNEVTFVVIDGQHRVETVRRVTSNTGKILCRVFVDLTIEEEAQMFLDLNAGNQPGLIDKFRVRVTAGDPVAMTINETIQAYGWTITTANGPGNIQAPGALERIHKKSELIGAEPPLVQATIMVITRAWGTDRDATHAVLLEGIAALIGEHGNLLDLPRLTERLKAFPGGPSGLKASAQDLAGIRRGKVHMAVAEILTDDYNKHLRSGKLTTWNRR